MSAYAIAGWVLIGWLSVLFLIVWALWRAAQ